MEPLDNVSKNDFIGSGWEKVIAECSERECRAYCLCFCKKAEEAKQSGDFKVQQIFILLGAITSLHLNLDSKTEPFKPMMVMHDCRTATIDDFNKTHLDFLNEIVREVTDAELQARIADILWLRKRCYRIAQLAITAYLESAKHLQDPQHWPATVERIERALQLADNLGQNNSLFTSVINHIEDVLATYDSGDPLFLSAKLMTLLQNRKLGKFTENAIRANKAALCAESEKEWRRARTYWGIKAKWYQLDKDEQQARDAKLLEAETYVKEAEGALKWEPPSYMNAAAHIQFAIEAFRRIKDTKERVRELHETLLEYRQKSTSELILSSSSVDASKLVQLAVEHVKGKPLLEALLHLAMIVGSPKVEELRLQAQKNKKEFLFQSLFPCVFINAMGRVIARQPQDVEESLQADMFSNASKSQGLLVQTLIEPARRQINAEHYVRVDDFLLFLTNNPLVRPGRELIIARGLHAGLIGDFLTGVHFLIPQLEDSIRYLLSHMKVISSKLDTDGIQEEFNINQFLSDPKFTNPLTKSLGEDFMFDLRGLLVERFGTNLRNNMAHGLVDHDSFYSLPGSYLWWLTLRFYSRPTLAKLQKNQSNADNTES